MDQLCSAAGVEGHALVIDCATEEATPIPLPDDLAVWVVDSGEPRRLTESAYAARRTEAEAAADLLGPLRDAPLDRIEELDDDVLRRRARHVRSECERVRRFAAAMIDGDLSTAGELVTASHRSLRDDAEVSTATLDALVDELAATPGVDPALVADAHDALATSDFYVTWLKRLEGLPRDEWEPHAESARQTWRLLAEEAERRGDAAAAARHGANLEAVIRLARLDPDQLQGLPIPSQCRKCQGGKCRSCKGKSKGKTPPQRAPDNRGAGGGAPVDESGS